MTRLCFLMTMFTGAAAALAPLPGIAQTQNCAAHEQVVDRLAERYNESRQVIGVAANGTVMEVYADIDAGGWSIVITQPTGTACLVASGQHFQNVAEVLPVVEGDGA